MKEKKLLVSVKRAGQTTKSLQADKPWSNLLENVEVSHQDQVWVSDITYVRLKGRFIYLCLLMDVFTRMIRAWQLSQHLTQSLTLKPLKEALGHSVPEIHHSDQGVQYLSKVYITMLEAHGIEISVAQRGRPWENGYAERLIRTCTAIGNSDHPLNQDCDTIQSQRKEHSDGETKTKNLHSGV